ncbi:hypothetical protein XVE_4539 [Xanthomonas vesicatoria ATCC 35937]|uniref:Uncharacterized protein n=1 Tax=Xanthomonas vesicatoria ATCC 35937 TaxID=925775 RepID=F0BJT4_9XANT|nr:hypothetical protein XVE_4539 [Xanthomonas vesicatoria ATCC 35937]
MQALFASAFSDRDVAQHLPTQLLPGAIQAAATVLLKPGSAQIAHQAGRHRDVQ